MPTPAHDPLQPVLRDAEEELRRRLREACEAEARDIENETTSDIRRLEDALLAAAVAAENTLTLRRQVRQRDQAPRKSGDATTRPEAPAPSRPPQPLPPPQSLRDPGAEPDAKAPRDSGTNLREFKDSAGRTWRAWMITPGLSPQARTRNLLGEFQLGWVCFEDLAAGKRRRLAGHPERWSELSEQELDVLLQQAITERERPAARKNTRAPDSETPPDST